MLATLLALGGAATRPQVKTRTQFLKQPEVHGRIRFPANTRLEVMDSGAVYYAWPGEDLKANGITILRGTQLMVFGNGHVSQFWSVLGQKIHEFTLPEGTWVQFRPDGALASFMLDQPQTLRGIKLVSHVQLYRSGAFKEGTLSEDQSVNGFALRKGTVTFHPNGRLMSGTLAQELRLPPKEAWKKERVLKANRRIFVSEAGEVIPPAPGVKELYPDPEL